MSKRAGWGPIVALAGIVVVVSFVLWRSDRTGTDQSPVAVLQPDALWLALAIVVGLAALGSACVWWLARFARLLDVFGRLGEQECKDPAE
jgi:hypothetical protein